MAMARKDLGEALVAKKVITPEQLAEAREVQRSAPGDIGKIIVDLGFAEEKPVVQTRAEIMGLAFVDLSTQRIDEGAAHSVPEQIARRHKIIAVGKNGNKLMCAVVNNDPLAIQDIRLATGVQQVAIALATEDDVMNAIDRVYKNGASGGTDLATAAGDAPSGPVIPLGGAMGGGAAGLSSELRQAIAGYGAKEEISDEDTESIAKVSEEAPIIRIAYTIIQQAIKDGASDIHVEPDRRGVRVRYRIDGVLHEVMPLPKYIEKPLTSRFKIMSRHEHRRTQSAAGRPHRCCVGQERLRPACFLSAHCQRREDRYENSGQVQRSSRSQQAGIFSGSAGTGR